MQNLNDADGQHLVAKGNRYSCKSSMRWCIQDSIPDVEVTEDAFSQLEAGLLNDASAAGKLELHCVWKQDGNSQLRLVLGEGRDIPAGRRNSFCDHIS